jgi:hypothetical protein
LLCSQGWSWTLDPPASATWENTGIIGMVPHTLLTPASYSPFSLAKTFRFLFSMVHAYLSVRLCSASLLWLI